MAHRRATPSLFFCIINVNAATCPPFFPARPIRPPFFFRPGIWLPHDCALVGLQPCPDPPTRYVVSNLVVERRDEDPPDLSRLALSFAISSRAPRHQPSFMPWIPFSHFPVTLFFNLGSRRGQNSVCRRCGIDDFTVEHQTTAHVCTCSQTLPKFPGFPSLPPIPPPAGRLKNSLQPLSSPPPAFFSGRFPRTTFVSLVHQEAVVTPPEFPTPVPSLRVSCAAGSMFSLHALFPPFFSFRTQPCPPFTLPP